MKETSKQLIKNKDKNYNKQWKIYIRADTLNRVTYLSLNQLPLPVTVNKL